MTNYLVVAAANIAFVAFLLLPLVLRKTLRVDWRWLALAIGLFFAYFSVLLGGSMVFVLGTWNWSGKILAIGLWIATLFAFTLTIQGFDPKHAGFTLRQAPGSFRPALMGVIAFVVLQVIITHLYPDNGYRPSAEVLLFQATMPGLDEEPWYRGLLLFVLGRALAGPVFQVFGARMDFAGLVLSLHFGLIHGVRFDGTDWDVQPLYAVIAGSYGLILVWLRQRTGSLLLPVLAHNLVNFTGQFRLF